MQMHQCVIGLIAMDLAGEGRRVLHVCVYLSC